MPSVRAHDFGKPEDRFKHHHSALQKDLDLIPEENILEPQLPERTIKGYVNMDKGVERFPLKTNEDPFYDD